MRLAVAVFLAAMMAPAAAGAQDVKYVGVWEGVGGIPIYTKLMFGADEGLTYCSVQNCRQVSCWEMDYRGDIAGKFSYADDLRSWEFEWTGESEIQATLTNAEGGQAVAVYEPE